MIFLDSSKICYAQNTFMNESHYYHSIAIATHSGYGSMKKYHRHYGSWRAAYEALAEHPALLPEKSLPLPDPREAYERMTLFGIRLALHTSPEFPDALRHIPYPPLAIYLRGAVITNDAMLAPSARCSAPPTIAIVGTRRASMDGKKIARYFARELAVAGCTIASGLAFGIDAAAHEGALDACGAGLSTARNTSARAAATIAVLAGGLDAVYPHSHRALAERILASGGTLISEYPPGEPPLAYRFIERNRIMSGLSRGVLIVEAPESSGALATARYAVEQDREVFVVPGAVSSANFKGSHALIRQGAELVTTPNDIFDAYNIDKKKNINGHIAAASPEETLILKALTEICVPADVDKLITLTRLEPRVVNQTLSFLLLRGNIKESNGGYTI